MSEVTIIGIGLAKRVFHLHGARVDRYVASKKIFVKISWLNADWVSKVRIRSPKLDMVGENGATLHPYLSISQQCKLLSIARSSYYY